jgi:hypothetical protein
VHEYIVAADIAKKRDFFGIMIMRDNPQIVPGHELLEAADRIVHYYDIVTIEKYQGMGYEAMAERLEDIMRNAVLVNNADLLIDGTGIGDAVVEMIRARNLFPISIIFSGGTVPREERAAMGEVFKGSSGKLAGARVLKHISVPKKDLVAAGSILAQQNRVRIAPGRWTEDFKKQLINFKGKVNEESRRIKFEAGTETVHDDLVVCYLMGSWWIKYRKERDSIPERTLEQGTDKDLSWEPFDYMA